MMLRSVYKHKRWLCVCMLFISGCGFPLPVYIDNPAQDSSEQFVVGKTTRVEARNLLGSPMVIEEALDAELFHCSGTIGVLLFYFYIPVWYATDELPCWAIVAYQDELVEQFDAGAFFDLKTKDFIYDHSNNDLLVSFDYYSRKMRKRGDENETDKSGCSLYVSAKNTRSILLDDNYLGYGQTEGGYFYREVSPGVHQLKACYSTRLDFECRDPVAFECNENQPVYFNAYPEETNFWGVPRGKTVVIERSMVAPEWVSEDKIIVRQGFNVDKHRYFKSVNTPHD